MKLLLVIDVADDVAEAYEDITVDYDLRGTPKDDHKVNESIQYVEDCPLRPLPSKRKIPFTKTFGTPFNKGKAKGWNACLDEIFGETE